jgi:CrcB protein
MKTLSVALGGLLGSVARYWLANWVGPRLFPLGILVVNVLGSFAIGLIAAVAAERGPVRPETVLFLTVGLCGGFTTMSAFSYDTAMLLQNGRPTLAMLNVALTLVACIAAVWVGEAAGRMLQ